MKYICNDIPCYWMLVRCYKVPTVCISLVPKQYSIDVHTPVSCLKICAYV